MHACAVLFENDRATARGQDQVVLLGELVNQGGLALAKPCFAFEFKNSGYLYATALFEQAVAVDKTGAQSACQQLADS